MPRMPDQTDLSQSRAVSPNVVEGPRDFIGPALENLGEGLQRQAAQISAEDDALDLTRARTDWNVRRYTESENYSPDKNPDYGKWETAYTSNISKHQKAAAEKIRNPRLRERFLLETQSDIAQGTLEVKGRATDLDRSIRYQDAMGGIEQQISLAATPELPEKEVSRILAETRANIDNLAATGVINPDDAISMRRKFTERVAGLKIEQRVQADPVTAYEHLTDTVTAYKRSLPGAESSNDPTARNLTVVDGKKATAGGLHQFTEGTWNDLMKRHPELGLTPQGRFDRAESNRAFDVFTNENAEILKKKKLPLTKTNLYAMHFMGQGGGPALLTSDPNANAAALFPEQASWNKAIFYEKDGQPRTVAGVLQDLGKRIKDKGDSKRPDYYEFVSAEDRVRLASAAEKGWDDIIQASEAEKFMLKTAMQNDLSQIAETGQATDLPRESIAAAFGDDNALEWEAERATSMSIFREKTAIDQMPNDQIAAHVEALKPQAGAENFAAAFRIYEASVAHAQTVAKEREADPAGHVARTVPHVKALWEKYDPANPSSAAPAIAASIQAQRDMGIPPDRISPIPANQATADSDVIRDSNVPLDQRINQFEVMMGMATDSKAPPNEKVAMQNQMMAQLVKAGLPSSIANVAEALGRGDKGAARRLMTAATIDPKMAPKLDTKDSEITKAVEAAFLDKGTIGNAFYSLDLGAPENVAMARSDMDLAKSAVRIAVAGGADVESAVAQVTRDIFGDVKAVDLELGAGTGVVGSIPSSADERQFRAGIIKATEKMGDVLDGYVARSFGLVPAMSDSARDMWDGMMGNERKNAAADAEWRMINGGWGLLHKASNSFAADDEGKIITFTTDEIMGMAPPQEKTVTGTSFMGMPAK